MNQKNLTLKETIDLRDWLLRTKKAEVPFILAETCPVEIDLARFRSGDKSQIEAVSIWTENAVSQVANRSGKAMWRWNLCAPIEIKAALSHPGIPVRIPWPDAATDDERFRAIFSECEKAEIKTATPLGMPSIMPEIRNSD